MLCPPLCRWGLSHLCTVIPSQGSSGFLSERVKCAATFAACWYWSLPIRQQFITLWKYFYMLHAEKITTSALLELSHMKEPGRKPQWMLRKEEDLCPVLQANMAPLPSNQEVKMWTVRLLFCDPCLHLLWGGDSPWEHTDGYDPVPSHTLCEDSVPVQGLQACPTPQGACYHRHIPSSGSPFPFTNFSSKTLTDHFPIHLSPVPSFPQSICSKAQ